MNYYERHIGDYLKDTAHLSLLEHGLYCRLLDVYYTREGPIPEAQAARLIGVRSKDEREALANVVREFFVLDGNDLRNSRCDREISRYNEKRRKAAASANARWSGGAGHDVRNADAMRTHSEGNAPNHQTPVTRLSRERVGRQQVAVQVGPDGPARAGFEGHVSGSGPGAEAAAAMKAAGLSGVSATHPKMLALLAAGVTVAELQAAAVYAVGKGAGFAYALSRAEGQRRDAATVTALPGAPTAAGVDPDSVAAVQAEAERLGLARWVSGNLDAKGVHEPWPSFKARVRREQARVAGVAA